MLKTSDIDDVMVEITSNCNAMCLDCGRNLDGVNLNPNLKFGTAGNMKLETFKSVFNKEVLPNLTKVLLSIVFLECSKGVLQCH